LTDHLLGFGKGAECFARQALVAKPTVEALHVAILPGAAWFDERRADINASKKLSNATTNELRSVVTSDECRDASDREYVHQEVNQIITREPARDLQRNTFSGVLIDQRKHLQRTSVACPIKDKVDRPNMIHSFRAATADATGIASEPAFLRLFPRHSKPFSFPKSVDPFEIHGPALTA
jgi:hypothetical protein